MSWFDSANWYATPAEVFMLLGMLFVSGLCAVILSYKYQDAKMKLRGLVGKQDRTKEKNNQSPKKTNPRLHGTG